MGMVAGSDTRGLQARGKRGELYIDLNNYIFLSLSCSFSQVKF